MESTPANRTGNSVRLSGRKKLVFAVISVVAFFAVVEGAGQLLVDLSPDARWEKEQSHLIEEGFPSLKDALEPDPVLFWRMRPNLSNAEMIGKVSESQLRFTLSTDGDGHRLTPAPAKVEHTVLFLGDSCTLGIGVDDDEAFPARVQGLLPGVRCINAGVPGYTAYQGRRAFEGSNIDPAPGAVVITFGVNDDIAWDDRSDPEHGRQLAARRSGFFNQFRMVQFLRQFVPRSEPEPEADKSLKRPRLNEAEFDEEIRLLIRRCRESGSRSILVIWPYLAQMYRPGESWKQQVLRRIGETEGVPVVDLVSVFRARLDPSLFADVIHAGPKGCRLVAETLVPVLGKAIQDHDGR